ncbi:hypothetical protein GGX14DRAFT_463837, partial [Mycena pura]
MLASEALPPISHSVFSNRDRRSPPSDGRSSEYSAVSALSIDDVAATVEGQSFLGRHSLSALCFTLHLLMVLIHIAVLLSAIQHWEHRFTFLIEHQTTVSFWTTVVSQSFGTIYCAVLVFLTQKLAMQRTTELMTLTAVHDNISAWAGLGSALATQFNQLSVSASVLGTLSIVVYLGCISILHTSIPAILSADAFNATARVAIPASISGMPEYANSSVMNATRNYMVTFPAEFLPWRGIFDDSQTLGLSNGSLYEVLDVTTPGNDKAQSVEFEGIRLLVDGVSNLIPTECMSLPAAANIRSSTIAISDSEGHQGSPILFDQQSHSVRQNLTQLNLNFSRLELLRCSKSLVAQTALISAQSNTIINGSLYPDIHKTQSTWISGLELDFISQDSSLLGDDLWSAMFVFAFTSDFNGALDEYLMSHLGLDPFANTSGLILQVHDIENALSNLVAMLFWTGGHITVDQWYTRYLPSLDGSMRDRIPPKLVAGNATIIQQETLQIRLN